MAIKLLMAGGLGNQLFQYAACRTLSLELGVDLIIDTRYYLNAERHSPKDNWLQYFSVAARFENPGPRVHHLSRRLWRKINTPMRLRYKEPGLGYDPAFKDLPNNSIISGNFNSPIYFAHRWTEIASEFDSDKWIIPEVVNGRPLSEYAAIHVRRGDYVGNPRFEMVNPERYYREAINRVSSMPTLIFSDDHEYCQSRSWLRGHIFDENEHSVPLLDLMAMSRCKAVVVANSTFSWWAGWLAFQKGATVYAPAQWIDGHASADIAILPDGWIEVAT